MTHGQTQYQVRFDWGQQGADAIGEGADVVVWVDVLGTPVAPTVPVITVAGSLRNRSAVANWLLERQGDKGDRFMIAIVAAGETWESGEARFALEDFLAAGAVIDALAEVGIDYCSPEAAAASAAFTGLRNATGHLIGASSSGRELTERGFRADVDLAIAIDSSTVVPVLREFEFRA